MVNFKNIVFVLFALLLSTKTFIGDFRPFNYVLLAVASAFEVPLLLVLVASAIGLAVGSCSSSLILLIVFFLLYNLVTAIVNIEGITNSCFLYYRCIIYWIV